MKIKKRTQVERQLSMDNKDYTEGYNYINWIIFNGDGLAYNVASLAFLIIGIWLLSSFDEALNIFAQVIVGIIAIIISIVIFLLSIHSFKQLKKGISS